MALPGLYVLVKAPWYLAFRAELLSFPAGKHDDQVDAMGLIGQLLDRIRDITPAQAYTVPRVLFKAIAQLCGCCLAPLHSRPQHPRKLVYPLV